TGATEINENMKQAAADALARVAADDGLNKENILPDAMDKKTVPRIACAVAEVALADNVARKRVAPGEVRKITEKLILT
ncbi:MAG: NAD-dependent malic enzyme, partial [bacterium]